MNFKVSVTFSSVRDKDVCIGGLKRSGKFFGRYVNTWEVTGAYDSG